MLQFFFLYMKVFFLNRRYVHKLYITMYRIALKSLLWVSYWCKTWFSCHVSWNLNLCTFCHWFHIRFRLFHQLSWIKTAKHGHSARRWFPGLHNFRFRFWAWIRMICCGWSDSCAIYWKHRIALWWWLIFWFCSC